MGAFRLSSHQWGFMAADDVLMPGICVLKTNPFLPATLSLCTEQCCLDGVVALSHNLAAVRLDQAKTYSID